MEPDWSELKGGYRLPYDPRPAIERLAREPTDADAWGELWNELHHQGDVGEASYAAIPWLLDACGSVERDWNLFALIATIELERNRTANPPVPAWLEQGYRGALEKAKSLALSDLQSTNDPLVIRSAMAVVALASGDMKLGAALTVLESSEIDEFVDDRLAWSELYGSEAGR